MLIVTLTTTNDKFAMLRHHSSDRVTFSTYRRTVAVGRGDIAQLGGAIRSAASTARATTSTITSPRAVSGLGTTVSGINSIGRTRGDYDPSTRTSRGLTTSTTVARRAHTLNSGGRTVLSTGSTITSSGTHGSTLGTGRTLNSRLRRLRDISADSTMSDTSLRAHGRCSSTLGVARRLLLSSRVVDTTVCRDTSRRLRTTISGIGRSTLRRRRWSALRNNSEIVGRKAQSVRVVFIYANGIYQSPVNRLLVQQCLSNASVAISDTNARTLINRPVSPSDNHLVSDINVSSNRFQSHRLAQRLTRGTSLVLYFRRRRHGGVMSVTPTIIQHAFLIASFTGVYLCYTRRSLIGNLAIRRQLGSIVRTSSFVHPVVPTPHSIRSPFAGSFPMFHGTTGRAGGTV